jgi:tetratricopeptide (TPR) repeat protein
MVSVLLTFLLCVAGVLALRDPYSVRQFGRGRSYSEHGKYELAIECFDEAIRCNPDYSEAIFARGRAYQKLGNFRQAYEDFAETFRLAPSAEVDACTGYCLSKLKYHKEAVKCYTEAMRMGLISPGLLNNLGFSYIQLNRLDDAEQCLKQAVEGDEDLHAAHHNLVILFLKQARDGRPVQHAALLHASKAVECGSPSADLYHDAAALYALAAHQDSRFIRQAIEYLGKAVAYGLDPARLKSDPVFSSLRKNADFNRLCRAAASTKAPSEAVRLVDPL